MKTIGKSSLDKIIAALKSEGYEVIGPVLRDGAIVYDEIDSIEDLPAGWDGAILARRRHRVACANPHRSLALRARP